MGRPRGWWKRLGAMTGVWLACLPGGAVNAASQTPGVPPVTPYVRNPFLFKTADQAVAALRDRDILMRRSAVEWLANWVVVSYSYSDGPRDTWEKLRTETEAVCPLAQAVREMPLEDSQAAARLLAVIGRPAQSALPTLCEAVVQSDKMGYQEDYLVAVFSVCGGPNAVGQVLAGWLHAPEPADRMWVAGALGCCAALREIRPPAGMFPAPSSDKQDAWQKEFSTAAIPALAAALDDRVTAVRIAAAGSLAKMTWDFPGAPWEKAMPGLSRMALESDPTIRLAALKTLAVESGDMSPAIPAVRPALGRGGDERGYALAVLYHALHMDRARVAGMFLDDLGSADLAVRRAAAVDLHQAASSIPTVILFPAG